MNDLDEVKIIKLLSEHRVNFASGSEAESAPRVGDTGIIMFVDEESSDHAIYTVEAVRSDGQTIWLADFVAEELELVPPS